MAAEEHGDIESDIADQYHTLRELEDIPPRPLSRMRFYDDSESSGLETYEDSSSDDDSDNASVDSDFFSDESDIDIAEISAKFAMNTPPVKSPLTPTTFVDEVKSLPKIPPPAAHSSPPFLPRHSPELVQPRRHRYVDRGYSRSGLLHLKWFWASREEEWADYDAARDCSPYGGIANPAIRPSPTLEREIIPDPSPSLPPLTIHPRRGDLSALRNPVCAHMDRYFVHMPMWTISKALWMYDVHVATQTRSRAGTPTFSDDESDSSELEMSVLTEFSDDSDATLVESDSDSDCVADSNQPRAIVLKDALDDDFEEVSLSSPPSPSSPTCTTIQIRDAHPLSQPPPYSWNTTWYRRLEVLLKLAGNSETKHHNSPVGLPPSILVQ